MDDRKLLVTGGAGFIGSALVRHAVARGWFVVNLDALTYAGSLENLDDVAKSDAHVFVHGDVGDRALVARLLATHRPRAVVHLAAESHVDQSIDAPADFVRTNVVGTFDLLEATRAHWSALDTEARRAFRFLQVSTDEVYGSLGATGAFTESSPIAPSSPYAASKAAADAFVRAAHRTYGLPTLTTNGTNTYGPYQLPEKLIPLMTLNAIEERPLPVYGDGSQVRDWLFVDDHCAAILAVLERGEPGASYVVGARCERTNLDVVRAIGAALDSIAPRPGGARYASLVAHVEDRPGHDRRYAVDPNLVERATAWKPARAFDEALVETVRWYVANRPWCARASERAQRRTRLGLGRG